MAAGTLPASVYQNNGLGGSEAWWVIEIPKCPQNMYTAGQERAVLSILLAMLLALLKRYRLGMAVGFHG